MAAGAGRRRGQWRRALRVRIAALRGCGRCRAQRLLLEYDDERSGDFAPVAQGNAISFDVQERKLRLVAQVAREVWED